MNSPWIDAKERPPDLGNILVIFDDGEPGLICWVGGDSIRHRRIKFWMPFPEVPKPDPFEEYINNEVRRAVGTAGLPTPAMREWMRQAWNAGVQWQRNIMTYGDDAWKKAPGQRE